MMMPPHTFWGLQWDEWGSIVAVFTAVIVILRWLVKKMDIELFEPIRHQLQILHVSIQEFNDRQKRAEERMIDSDKKLQYHDDKIKEHERRINDLEEETKSWKR